MYVNSVKSLSGESGGGGGGGVTICFFLICKILSIS